MKLYATLSDNAHFYSFWFWLSFSLNIIIINYIIVHDIIIIYATTYYYILDENTYIIGFFF